MEAGTWNPAALPADAPGKVADGGLSPCVSITLKGDPAGCTGS